MKVGIACLIVLSGTVLAGELEDAKSAFAKRDTELNRAYAALKASLPEDTFKALRQEQREWTEYRDYISDWQAFGKAPATSPGKWETAAAVTEERVEWLKGWSRIGTRKGWTGKYVDSEGGLLQIMEKDGKHHFRISVVRGPTFHSGDIKGVLKIEGDKASYEVRSEPDAEPTRLSFTSVADGSGRLQVEGKNTSYFHGARAYFDGKYVWTGELTEQEKKDFAKEP